MNVNLPIKKIHNRFDIEVKDVTTGEIIQRGMAENIVLNKMFSTSALLSTSTDTTINFSTIHVGDGNGTPSPTNINLFNFLLAKTTTQVEKVVNGKGEASYVKNKILIATTELIGKTLTEVGLALSAIQTTLLTHAIIKDSEGNQLSIGPKTDTQEITIYSTLYATINAPDGIDLMNQSSGNFLIDSMLTSVSRVWHTDGTDTNSTQLSLSSNKTTSNNTTDYINLNILGRKAAGANKINTANKQKGTNRIRFNSNEGNGKIWSLIWGRGNSNSAILRMVFPNSLWAGYHFEGKAIGIGDGNTTKFILPWSDINTSKQYDFYVDGAKKTVGTDYTLANAENETSITFATAPASGVITGDWWVDYIPKDTDHVLDITFTITFGEGVYGGECMQLDFEYMQGVGVGNYPDLIHLWDNTANLLYIADGRMRSTYALTPNGEWDDREFIDDVDISIDENIESWRIDTLGGFGAIGAYKTGNIHKLVIYEYQHDLSEFLNSGSIKHSADNSISSFSLALENPDLNDPEHPGNVAVSEQSSLLSPGAKVIFKFGAGSNEAEHEMGTFYVDRSNFTLLSETATADGRNKIGKVLKDQTIDENNEYWYGFLSEHLKNLLEQSGLNNYEYIVENTEIEGWFSFSPNTTPLKVVESMLEILPQWRIKELSDGTIVIGNEDYSGFEQNGIYTFYRDKDIFSRQITRDDAEVYNRVCVHTNNFGKVAFRDVANFQSWNLQAKKTLYVQVSDGLKYANIEEYAEELALRLENVGKLESFVGPFRPHLIVGDEAVIVDINGNQSLGLITEITHNFGKSGFYTNFTVDSGGTVGKGRLSDYITKIAVGAIGQKADVGYDDIDMTSYINLSKFADIGTSSRHTVYRGELMKDGKKDATDLSPDAGWRPSRLDEAPWIEFKFKQRCIVDKIMLWLALELEDYEDYEEYLPTRYTIQYWNGAFWNDLAEAFIEDIEPEMTHSFTAVETSAIRFILTQEENRPVWREVEIWGYM